MSMMFDTLISNALVFDGSGELPQVEDIAIKDGHIVCRGLNLDVNLAKQNIDAKGKWLMPGLLDVHTHFDLEVELAPGLPEAVRHGSTTVIASNCSLGICYGSQVTAEQNPIVDCFARVENMPKPVLQKVVDKISWDNSADYLKHFDDLPLGPNIVTMIPHSMLRIEVMGLQDSITREPTPTELDKMCKLLEEGMQQGFAGFSTDALPFHYLANDPNRKEKIPTQFGSYKELKRLTNVVRDYERVWQATPPKDSKIQTFRNFALTSGRLHGKPLKVTAVAALDIVTNRSIAKMAMVITNLFNSWLLNGKFALQALSAPFRVWADGPITPLSEEVPELRELNEPDLDDRESRLALLKDSNYQERFRKMWYAGQESGPSWNKLKHKLGIDESALPRDLNAMTIGRCPVEGWEGQNMNAVYNRLIVWQNTGTGAASDEELTAFEAFPKPLAGAADFFLHALREYDTKFRWNVVSANDNPEMVKKLLFHPKILPGFNDSGAHITNMAFYDGNLRGLQMAQEDGLERVAYLVKRLTADPAAWFNLDVGTLKLGAQADITIVDPQALETYNSEAHTKLQYRDDFGHEQMVNRSDGVVSQVLINGHLAWDGKAYTPDFGKVKMGRALTVKGNAAVSQAPATVSAQAA